MRDLIEADSGVLERPSDAGEGKSGVVRRWKLEIELAEKIERGWRRDAKSAVERYRMEKEKEKGMNIFWSQVETLRPALYDSEPVPDIRRRFRDDDPMGKEVSETLERAITYLNDRNNFNEVLIKAVWDYLVPGRSVARVRYEPEFETIPEERIPFDAAEGVDNENVVVDEDGQTTVVLPEVEQLVDENVTTELVYWGDFTHDPAKKWKDVKWIKFDHRLTREMAEQWFGKDKAGKLAQDVVVGDVSEEKANIEPDIFKRSLVWEIWDKTDRTVKFIAPSYEDEPLLVEEDPLNLHGFFPVPEPLMAVESTDTLVPVTELKQYEALADELNRITVRIRKIVDAMRVRGIYDSGVSEMSRLMSQEDNALVPTETPQHIIDKGGLEGAIYWMPIDMLKNVLEGLYVQRQQIKEQIFEITGLSDVLRGVSDPRETASAQNIKSQFGSLRLNRRQREVQRFARDLIRLQTEIVAEKFEPETLARMTGKQVPQEVVQLMRDDQLRSYRVDIETDSTIAVQLQQDEQDISQFLGGVASFVEAIGPAVASGMFPMKAATSMLEVASRRFKFGRKFEDAIEEVGNQQIQPQQGEPQEQQQDIGPQEAQLKAAELQQKQAIEGGKIQNEAIEQESQNQAEALRIQLEREKLQFEIERMRAENELKREELELKKRELASRGDDA